MAVDASEIMLLAFSKVSPVRSPMVLRSSDTGCVSCRQQDVMPKENCQAQGTLCRGVQPACSNLRIKALQPGNMRIDSGCADHLLLRYTHGYSIAI
jgi:hypothetical protein